MAPRPPSLRFYTRKSTEHNLDLELNSLDAQREACEAYIKNQAHGGWRLIPTRYDDGAFSGASLERPALQKLFAEFRARKVGMVVVYKVDRLTRSLADFAKLVELFDQHAVSFVSVTQSFNTTTSMGRLFDDCGNRMTPTHTNKHGPRYRYYVSHAILQKRHDEAGSVGRVPAPEIERIVVKALRDRHDDAAGDGHLVQAGDRDLIEHLVDRIVVRPAAIDIHLLAGSDGEDRGQGRGSTTSSRTNATPPSRSGARPCAGIL